MGLLGDVSKEGVESVHSALDGCLLSQASLGSTLWSPAFNWQRRFNTWRTIDPFPFCPCWWAVIHHRLHSLVSPPSFMSVVIAALSSNPSPPIGPHVALSQVRQALLLGPLLREPPTQHLKEVWIQARAGGERRLRKAPWRSAQESVSLVPRTAAAGQRCLVWRALSRAAAETSAAKTRRLCQFQP